MKKITQQAVRLFAPGLRDMPDDVLTDGMRETAPASRGGFEWYLHELYVREVLRRGRAFARRIDDRERELFSGSFDWEMTSDRLTLSVTGNRHLAETMMKTLDKAGLGPFELRKVGA